MRQSKCWADRLRASRVRIRVLLRDERGSAALEFLTAGILLLVPLVYVVLALASVQAATFAVEGAARHAARTAALAADDRTARSAAERTVRTVLEDADMDPGAAAIDVSCEPKSACTAAGARVRVEVATAVALPLVPDLFGLRIGTVQVEGVATQTVSKYAGAGR